MDRSSPLPMFRSGAFALAIAALTTSLPTLAAPGDKLGGELRVNTFTAESQDAPALARSANGDFVVVFADYSGFNDSSGIYYRRYRANGVAKDSSAVLVAAPISDSQLLRNPDVAVDEDGDFVVAWRSTLRDTSARYFSDIKLLRYNAAGAKQDLNALTVSCLSRNKAASADELTLTGPSVAMDSAGDFVVADTSYVQNDNARPFPTASLFRSNGTLASGCVRVGTRLGLHPVVAMESDGDFAVAFETVLAANRTRDIVARRFSAAGAARDGADIVVASSVAVPIEIPGVRPAIAINDLSEFIVTWTSPSASVNATSSRIEIRRYDGNGAAKGAAVPANASASNFSRDSRIGLANDGSFTVAWEQLVTANNNDVMRRSFNANGVAVSGDVRVNTVTASFQDDPALAVNADGSFVVAWESANQDGLGDGVYAQRHEGSPTSLPTVQFAVSSSSVAETIGTARVPLLLSAATTRDVKVPISPSGSATLGKDYRLPTSTVPILAGLTSANSRVVVVNDTTTEGNETVVLTLGAPVNARPGSRQVHTLTIQSND